MKWLNGERILRGSLAFSLCVPPVCQLGTTSGLACFRGVTRSASSWSWRRWATGGTSTGNPFRLIPARHTQSRRASLACLLRPVWPGCVARQPFSGGDRPDRRHHPNPLRRSVPGRAPGPADCCTGPQLPTTGVGRPAPVSSGTRLRSCALRATTTVLADIRTAPAAGVRRMPQADSAPAARGMATTL